MPGKVQVTDENGTNLSTTVSEIILDGATATGAGSSVPMRGAHTTFQATSDASHTGTSTVDIEVSNDDVSWIVMGTLSVTDASDSDGLASSAAWKYVRPNCTAHGDSTNEVTVTMGG